MPSISAKTTQRGLTSRQARFVKEFMVDSNAKAACERMGNKPASAGPMGHAMLQLPKVKEEIARLQEKLIVKQGRTLEEIAERVELLGFAPENSLIAAKEDHVKNADRLKALEILIRLKGGFQDKLEVSGAITTVQLSWVDIMSARAEKERKRLEDEKAVNASFRLTEGGQDGS